MNKVNPTLLYNIETRLKKLQHTAFKMEKIAIDVGGVLIRKKELDGPDTNFDIDNIKWMPGALDAIKTLHEKYDLYILSFCGKKTERETRVALKKEVFQYIPEWKWIFTREREHKIDRMKQHGITTLVDDTEKIIQWVHDAGLKGILYGGKDTPDWESVVKTLVK